jgi:hypothetical protein
MGLVADSAGCQAELERASAGTVDSGRGGNYVGTSLITGDVAQSALRKRIFPATAVSRTGSIARARGRVCREMTGRPSVVLPTRSEHFNKRMSTSRPAHALHAG